MVFSLQEPLQVSHVEPNTVSEEHEEHAEPLALKGRFGEAIGDSR